jgi:predicted PurR-regulated permease PerM
LFLPRLIRDVSGFADEIPRAIDFIIKTAEEIRDGRLTIIPEQVLGWIDIDKEMARIADVVKQSLADFSGWLIASGSKLLDLIMTPIITFYYLKDKELIRETILGAFKPEGRNRAVEIAGDVDKVIGGFIRGQITVAAFVGVLTGLGCMIIGVPHALTIGVVAGLTNIIPYFGPWLGGIMPVILALMEKPLMALWVVVLIVAVQQVEASFISPQIMSHSVGLHPLLVMFSVLLFGSVLGIPGMIIGVPLMATLKVFWSHIKKYRQRYEKKKKITQS